MDQANIIEQTSPQQAKAIRDRVYGSQEHPSMGAVLNNRLKCDGKQPSARFEPYNKVLNPSQNIQQRDI